MLPDRESLTVEFKSEQRRPQSDDEIVDNVVALANTQGGTLYLGIEDNGIVTGVSEQHSNINGLAAFIFNKTVPQQTTRIESFHEHGCQVVVIEVDNSQQIVSTSNGKTLQRRLKADGTPEECRYSSRNSSAVSHNNAVTITATCQPQAASSQIWIPKPGTNCASTFARPIQTVHC